MEAIWVAAEMRAGGAYAHSVLALATPLPTCPRRAGLTGPPPAPGTEQSMYPRLLVAFDDSRHAHAALEQAIELAHANGSQLTVMTVVPEPTVWALGDGYGAPVNVDEVRQEALVNAVARRSIAPSRLCRRIYR